MKEKKANAQAKFMLTGSKKGRGRPSGAMNPIKKKLAAAKYA